MNCQTKDKKIFNNIIAAIFGLAALLYNTASFTSIAFCLIVFASLALTISWILEKPMKIDEGVFLSMFAIILLYLWAVFRNITGIAVSNICSMIITFMIYIAFSKVNLSCFSLLVQQIIMAIQLVVIYFPGFCGRGYSEFDGGYMSIFTTTTFLGLFSCLAIQFCVLFFSKTHKKIWIIYMFLWFVLMMRTKVRTAFFVLLFLTLFIISKKIEKKVKGFCTNDKRKKWIVYVLLILIVIVYPKIDSFFFYEGLSRLIFKYSGKMLLTGRNVIWKSAMDVILKSPICGYGLDCNKVFYDVYGYSIHSSYLNILLQTGILGLLMIFAFINKVIKKMSLCQHNKLLLYMFLCNLIMCSTEVALFQGQIILQLAIWTLAGIGCNKYFVKEC